LAIFTSALGTRVAIGHHSKISAFLHSSAVFSKQRAAAETQISLSLVTSLISGKCCLNWMRNVRRNSAPRKQSHLPNWTWCFTNIGTRLQLLNVLPKLVRTG